MDKQHIGLSFDDFKQALLRIAIKGKQIINKIVEKMKSGDFKKEDMASLIQENSNI